MGNKLITQSILVITSITIIMTYIRPSFDDIAEIQDDLARYQSTVDKAAELNAALQNLVATEQSIASRDQEKLRSYLPRSINNVMVMRDIQNIFNVSGVGMSSLTSVTADAIATSLVGSDEPRGSASPQLVFRDFEITFVGTYEDLKRVLGAIESNAYPLEVVDLSFKSSTDPTAAERELGMRPGMMRYEMTLRTYALPTS